MKTVLVTGSNGLLGQKLTGLYLQRNDVKLIATGKGPDRYPASGDYEYATMDITNRDEVLEVIRKYRPDTVIHGAAMTNVDACELDHASCDAQNVDAVSYIVEACNEVQAHLVHVSTDFIFDGKNGPYTEEAEPAPLSYYGNSKLKGEEIVMQNSKSWAIARTVLVYGVVADMSRSNIVLWAKGALEKGAPMNVVDDQFRTPTLAEDLAAGCMLIEQKRAQGVYNISGKDFMSVYELVCRVAQFFKLDAGVVNRSNSQTFTQPAARPLVTGFVLDKAYRDLGYNPHSFEEGLALVQQQLTRAAV